MQVIVLYVDFPYEWGEIFDVYRYDPEKGEQYYIDKWNNEHKNPYEKCVSATVFTLKEENNRGAQ